jgi:hypothetical protein
VRRITAGFVALLAFTGTLLTLPVYAAPAEEAQPIATAIDEVALGSVTDPQGDAVVTTDGEVQAGGAGAVDGSGAPSAASSTSAAPDTGATPGTGAPSSPTSTGDSPAGEAAVSGDELPGVPALTVSQPDTGAFESVGVTWRQDSAVVDVVARIRVKDLAGNWGEWTTLERDDVVQTVSAETRDHDVRDGTAPYWTGRSVGIEAIVQGADGAVPQDVRLALLDPGTSKADALPATAGPTSTANAAGPMPRVYTRAEWGADESIRTWGPEYPSTIKAATIHHTADSNNYTAAQVPAIMRSMYAYHAQTRGWGDLGYNVIVDKFGRMFEGRYGGLTSTVVGAHAGGFNTFTFGVSMLGNYDIAPVPQATVNAVAEIIAWKFGLYGVDPRGTAVLTSGGGGTAKYAAGVRVTLPTIFGHRDVGSTACPGVYGYARLGEIRDRVTALVAAASRTLVRTPENASVYVVSGTNKYPVDDMATLSALSPLGAVGFVSQQYLNGLTTGPRMSSRVVLAPDGSVYFIDAGIRLPFSSCAQVADYGGSCDSLVRLAQPLIDAFASGPPITALYRTTSGKAFYVAGGVKREAVDDAALTQAGLPTSGVTLLETGLASLPYGVPITRDGLALQVRGTGTGTVTVSLGGAFTTVSEGVRAATALSALPVRPLDAGSAQRLPTSSALGALVKESAGSTVFLLTEQGKKHVTSPVTIPASVPVLGDAVLGMFPDAGTLDPGVFLKGSGAGSVYVLREGSRRAVGSWKDLVALNGGNPSPRILTIDQRVADVLPAGPAQLGPGSLVVAPRNATVYFVNGTDELIPVRSFAPTIEVGATRVTRVTNADVDAYSVRSSGISTAVDCGGTQYLGLGGKLYRVGSDVVDAYRLSFTTVDPVACAGLPKAAGGLTRFLRADSGTIYHIEAGTKRPIGSYAGYQALGGTSATTIQASDFALSLIPTGAAR